MKAAVASEPIVKRCSCGKEYTRAGWEALPDRTVYTLEWLAVHEQRECACGSHIVVVLEKGEPEPRRGQRWYRRGTGRPISVVALARGNPPMVTYRTGVRRAAMTATDFWAAFTKTAPKVKAKR